MGLKLVIMMTSNIPYVKMYNKSGECTNPIDGIYSTGASDRQSRRSLLQKTRFFGNGKNTPLTVTPTVKYLRVRQRIINKDGSIKTIEHYVLMS